MRAPLKLAALIVPVALAAPAAAQIYQASGFATISIAGLGNTTTVAGDSRLPILTQDVSYSPDSKQLHLRATGRRGAVRQLDIDVRNAQAGQRYGFGSSTGASLRVRMDRGRELAATTGRGHITIESIDGRRVSGSYEGTFNNGAVPIVLRGRFEASLVPPRRNRAASTTPSRTDTTRASTAR